MTYKKADFYSSPTMRQFSKIASDKGWLKSEKPIEKKASVANEPKGFIENAISLTAELRKQNNVVLNKLAEEIEYNLMQYKVASVYGVFNETGEDLVDQAHPDGSHKMEGMIGDAVIETVVDQQKKIHEVVFKKSKGKLANRELIQLVKQAALFGSEKKEEELKKLFNQVKPLFEKHVVDKIQKIVSAATVWLNDDNNTTIEERSSDLISKMISNLNTKMFALKRIPHTINSGVFYNGTVIETLNDINGQLTNIITDFNNIIGRKLPGWMSEIKNIINSFQANVINKLVQKATAQIDEVADIDSSIESHKSPEPIDYEPLKQIQSYIKSKINSISEKIAYIDNQVKRVQLLERGTGYYAKQIRWVEDLKRKLSTIKNDFKQAANVIMSENYKETRINGIKISNNSDVDKAFEKCQSIFDAVSGIEEIQQEIDPVTRKKI